MKSSRIRIATRRDAAKLLEIYAPYVEKTAVTFEYEVPAVTEFEKRIDHILGKYPYLVAERAGDISGYAYAECVGCSDSLKNLPKKLKMPVDKAGALC